MRTSKSLLPPLTFLALAASLTACASRSDDAGGDVEARAGSVASAVTQTITEVTSFGTNPGGLKMFEYVPSALPPKAPLVVVLHGCTEGAQNAAMTGWNDVADDAHFAVVYPEQETTNNPVRCFNWAGEYGDPSDIQRGKGENLSIKQMVDTAVAAHGSDPARVFVVGFSAGGAMSAVMAATYPDVFAGGAVLAGVPYDCTTTYSEVSGCQSPGKTKSAADWAALVKADYPGYTGAWPRMSIWQGNADTTVGTANRMELVKQWAGVHGVDAVTPVSDTVDGQSHAVYKDSKGTVQVETYEIAGMSHAVPVVPGKTCGAASQYAVDKGICAARHIADFFGITSTPTGFADAGSSGTSGSSGSSGSSGVSSSSSTGGLGSSGSSGSSGAGTSGGAAAGGGDDRHGSTCSVTRPVGSGSHQARWWWTGALALGLALGALRTRSRAR